MSEIKVPFEQGKFYHVYNRGNNGNDIFLDYDCYIYFLKLYKKYINPIIDTYAWCLLKNHFHFLVYVKSNNEIELENLRYSTVEKPKQINASRQFSHLFNSYTQSVNKKFNRTGVLFESRFERKLVTNISYFQKLIYYIHLNPVKHKIVSDINDYLWTSYNSILSDKVTDLKRIEVINQFENKENFIKFHQQEQNLYDIKDLLIDDF